MVKKIGILTSGGDCGGLNAVVRAATLRAVNEYQWKVYGIKDGTLGLLTMCIGGGQGIALAIERI